MNSGLRNVRLAAAVITLLTTGAAPADTGRDTELIEIEKVVGYYLDSGKTGDVDLLRKAFHPSLRLQFAQDGAYTEWSGGDYIGWRKPGQKSVYTARILSIDNVGSAAMAKVELDFDNVVFVDYLSLLRLEDRWWIVNKVFNKEVKNVGQ